MNVNPVADIRETSRTVTRYRRQMQRDELINLSRNIGTSVCQQNIVDIIEKLKTKSSINVHELNLLKNELFENVDYTPLFLSVHGALRGLIRELTGTDIIKQYEAVGCLCNLALGNNKACHTIAKTAGTYLVASLDSIGIELPGTSALTIGNLVSSDLQCCEILHAQGALSKLAYTLELNQSSIIRERLFYALEHFIFTMKDDMSDDALQKIFQALKARSEDSEISYTLFLMSCHSKFLSIALLDDNFMEYSLKTYLEKLEVQCYDEYSECSNFVYITRTLANVCISSNICDKVLNNLVKSNVSSKLFSICNTKFVRVCNAQLWFLGNLFNFASDSELKRDFFHSLFEDTARER